MRHAMARILRRMREQYNFASLIAHMCGFFSAALLHFVFTVVLVRWLHGSVPVIWLAYSLNSVMSLIGCLIVLGMARIGSFADTPSQFFRDFRFAFTTALFMPFLVVVVLAIHLVGAFHRSSRLDLTLYQQNSGDI